MKQPAQYCLELFPEILSLFDLQTLQDAAEIGLYIFFEDHFNAFLEVNKNNEDMLQRASDFIEQLAQSNDQTIQTLVEIGILEGLVNRDVSGIAKHLKQQSKKLLNQATSRTKIDRILWRLGTDK